MLSDRNLNKSGFKGFLWPLLVFGLNVDSTQPLLELA